MKRILFAIAITLGISHMAAAQTSGSNSTNGPIVSSSRAKATTNSTNASSNSVNERKVYHWKDGQRATPTGHEATGLGDNAAPLPKDSAKLDSDSTRQKPVS